MSNRRICVGAQVRFLSAVGGGRVSRLTKDTAWVEDADGFEIPTPISECVVVDEGDTFMPAYKPPKLSAQAGTSADKGAILVAKEQGASQDSESMSTELVIPKPHTYLPASGEVSLSLGVLPLDYARLGQTSYELYLINDSQYNLYYVLSTCEGVRYKLRAHGTADPDCSLFLLEVSPQELNDWKELNVQVMAYADNPGIYKATYSLDSRLNLSKFFKRHSFVPTDFFDDDALLIPLVSEGKPLEKELRFDTHSIDQAILMPPTQTYKPPTSKKSSPFKINEPLVIDLHIDELLDSTAGMSSVDILRYQLDKFNEVMQSSLPHKGRKVIFIHGKGEGVLRNKLIGELRYRYKQCRWQDASFLEYSYGATQVTIG